jgi:hypothetical protein
MLNVYMRDQHVAMINQQSKAADGYRADVPWLLLLNDGRVLRYGSQAKAKDEARKRWAPVTFKRGPAQPKPRRELSEHRKADREKMADQLTELAIGLGATVERSREAGREIRLEIVGAQGLQVGISFDGESWQADTHVVPWNIGFGWPARLAPSFGEVNPYHFRKATHVAEGFDELLAEIRRGLELAKSGKAFQAESLRD